MSYISRFALRSMHRVRTVDRSQNQFSISTLIIILVGLLMVTSGPLIGFTYISPTNTGEIELESADEKANAPTFNTDKNTKGKHLISGGLWAPHNYSITATDSDGDGVVDSEDPKPNDNTYPLSNIASPCIVTGAHCPTDIAGLAFDESPNWKQTSTDTALDAEFADIDNDGDLDLALAQGGVKIFCNEKGALTTEACQSIAVTVNTIKFLDIENDGDLDILALGSDIAILENNEGIFSVQSTIYLSTYSSSIDVGDINSDGLTDIVVGGGTLYWDGDTKILLNTGGQFVADQNWTTITSKKSSVKLGDVDGDGDLDLVRGVYAEGLYLYLNTNNQLVSTDDWNESGGVNPLRIADISLGDVDNDGDLDVALAMSSSVTPDAVRLFDQGQYSNSGWEATNAYHSEHVRLADFDNDGDVDLALGHDGVSTDDTAYYYGRNMIKLNHNGSISLDSAWESDSVSYLSTIEIGDIDGDGDLDLLQSQPTNYSHITLNSAGMMSNSDSNPLHPGAIDYAFTHDIIFADIDGDGFQDIISGDYNSQNNILSVEYPPGGPVCDSSNIASNPQCNGFESDNAIWASPDNKSTYSLAVADYDDDGDLDLAVGNYGDVNQIFENTGTGLEHRWAVWNSSDSKLTTKVAWADYDNDGDLDLAVGNKGEVNQIFKNTGGTLSSTATWSSSDSMNTTDLEWGDLDGNGYLDLFIGNDEQNKQIFYNTGGVMSTSAGWLSADTYATRSIALADVDNDGDLDVAAGHETYYTTEVANRKGLIMYENNGTGVEHTHNRNLNYYPTYDIEFADIDSDGDLDLIYVLHGTSNSIISYSYGFNGIMPNVGGVIMASQIYETTLAKKTSSLAVGDLNNDGLLDLGYGYFGYSSDNSDNGYGVNEIFISSKYDNDGDWVSDEDDDFITNPTQDVDTDGDGFGDESDGMLPDDCVSYFGTSWRDRQGCQDEDGDGQSNLFDDFWTKPSQWTDSDGDGLGDNWGTAAWNSTRDDGWPGEFIDDRVWNADPSPLDYDNDGFEDSTLFDIGASAPYDTCQLTFGTSVHDVNGCIDSDYDGWSDVGDSHPGDATQHSDGDGDGYGDNASGNNPDSCPNISGTSIIDAFGCVDADGDGYSNIRDIDDDNSLEWSDLDEDGFGDNGDKCPYVYGTTITSNDRGCPDSDGDGYADRSDEMPHDASQNSDQDGDGFGDNLSDSCPASIGASWRGLLGCPDSDNDGWADSEDLCPNSFGVSGAPMRGCSDLDNDGVADVVDLFPDDANESTDSDGDGIGDNSDAYPNDWDNDGYASGVDWDDNDASEWEDTDGDGVGNNSDPWPEDPLLWSDADGDGYADQTGSAISDDCVTTVGTSTLFQQGCPDLDGDGMPDVLDSDIDGDGVTNDNEMDASKDGITYDPFNFSSKPADLDGDNIPDILDFDIDDDGFPNEFEMERGSDQLNAESTPFNVYGDQNTGFFYNPGEGFSSQYDPDGYEISLSLLVRALTTEFLIPIVMAVLTVFAIRRKKRRYKKVRSRLADIDEVKELDGAEEMIDKMILKHKVTIEHGVLLRNLFERRREELHNDDNFQQRIRGDGPPGGGGRRDLASRPESVTSIGEGVRSSVSRPSGRRPPRAGTFGLDSDD